MVEAAIFVIFPLSMAVMAFSDMLSMTIPNRVSVILIVSFVILAPLCGLPLAAVGMHLLAGLAVFGVCFALFALNVMGGGDAKVLTASAVWFGFTPELANFLVYVSIFGGLLTLGVVLLRSQAHILDASPFRLPAYMYNAKAGVPYGIAIGVAGMVTFPGSVLMRHALASIAG